MMIVVVIVSLFYGAVGGILSMNVFFGDESKLVRALIFLAAWTWPISLPIVFAHDWIVDRIELRRIIKRLKGREA